MNSIKPEVDLGTPKEIDIASIERELVSLWKSASETQTGATLRACSCNLITFWVFVYKLVK